MKNIGLIGLDTSHVSLFSGLFNDSSSPGYCNDSMRIVKAFPGGSAKFSNSYNRKGKFTQEAVEHGVELVTSIEGLSAMDAFLLSSADGDQHLEQFEILSRFGKPIFVDKPLACHYDDAKEIVKLAQQRKVPFLSTSSIRYAPGICDCRPDNSLVLGVESFGPMPFLNDYRDYFWYGIHSVDVIYSFLGCGCQQVRAVHHENVDILIGEWADGRVGMVSGNRIGINQFGVHLTTADGYITGTQDNAKTYLHALRFALNQLFLEQVAIVDAEESLEVIAFLEAASRSKAEQGRCVCLSEL